MEHIFLELFKTVDTQYILGPMAIAWLTAKLNKSLKPRKTRSRNHLHQSTLSL